MATATEWAAMNPNERIMAVCKSYGMPTTGTWASYSLCTVSAKAADLAAAVQAIVKKAPVGAMIGAPTMVGDTAQWVMLLPKAVVAPIGEA